ncbi:hypothetical protein ACQ5SK_21870 [Bradyrhizobium japonicum]
MTMNTAIITVVDFCSRRRWMVIVGGLLLLLGTASYTIARFSIDTDIEGLISKKLPWHERQVQLTHAFPQRAILAVVSAPTPENAEMATNELSGALAKDPNLFPRVAQPDSGKFFERNGLLLGSTSEVQKTAEGLARARPFIAELAADPSLRGVMKVLVSTTEGVQAGEIKLEQMAWPLSLAKQTLIDVLSGKPAFFSWQELLQGHTLPASQLRHFVEIAPKLNFSALQPGLAAEKGINKAAADLNLNSRLGANLSLTGQVPMNDEQFSVIRSSALRDTLTATLGVLIVLWLALRSWKLIISVFCSLVVGLAATAALGLLMVGSFNLISIAFLCCSWAWVWTSEFSSVCAIAPSGMNLAICDKRCAVRRKVRKTTRAGCRSHLCRLFAFLPTSYRGLSELGLIAGCGMLIAFACSITLVPAMLTVLNPPGEPAPIGFGSLGPLDRFLQRHRIAVIVGTFGVVLAGSPLLLHLQFDFDPVDLQRPIRRRSWRIDNRSPTRRPPATMRRSWHHRSNRLMPSPRALRRFLRFRAYSR